MPPGRICKGSVVVVPFPFSDLTQAKRRPALVITELKGDDFVLCQITSRTIRDGYSISVDETDFEEGSLKQTSNVRPNRLFTAHRRILLYQVGRLRREKIEEIIEKIVEILRQ